MSVVVRQVAWGKALMVELSEVRGGLRAVVNAIQAEIGPYIGSRNTFAKLYDVADPASLEVVDQYRAWLLLSAIGADPDGWGISRKCLPPRDAADPAGLAERLRTALVRHRGLEPLTRWFEFTENTVEWPAEMVA